jgi:molybdopterin-guanine dinucleotide biosynthesis protein A
MAGNAVSKPLVGVVLAGGQSRRMGRDKAMLEYKGSTLLANQVDCLAALCDRVVVSGNYAGYDCIRDQLGDVGPLAGLHAVATMFAESALLVLPVDMPAIDSRHLSALFNADEVRHFASQPLPAFFPDSRQLLAVIEAMMADGNLDFSMIRLHRTLGSHGIALTDSSLFANLNHPADWQAFTNRSAS